MNFLTELNAAEIAMAVAVIAACAFAFYLSPIRVADPASIGALRWQQPSMCISGIVVVAALLLSVSEVTQFMTLDETAFGEVLRDPRDRGIASIWAQGAAHTASLIWIPITRGLQAFSASAATIDASLKGVHWLLGMMFIVGIVWNVVALLPAPSAEKPYYALALAAMLLLLPVDNLALKTLNYDLISLFGSALAILLVARSHLEVNRRLLWAGVLLAALAAQEKLNASLVLMVLCLVVGLLAGVASPTRPRRTAAVTTLKAIGLAFAVSLASYGIAAMMLIGDPAIHVLLKTLPLFVEVLTVWIYAPLRFVFGTGNELADPIRRIWYSWGAVVATCVLLPLGAAFLVACRPRLGTVAAWLTRHSGLLFPAGLAFVVVVGIAGLWIVVPVFAPMVPLNPAVQTGGINGVQLHFGMPSAAAHRLAAIGFAYGVFIAALPTALVVAAVATAIRLAWRPRSAPFFDLMFAIAVVTPGILALMNTPTFNRYLNLPILWAAIVIVVRMMLVWMPVLRGRRWALLAWPVMAVAIIVEIAPFRPLYAAFRPITVSYTEAGAPAPGHLNFSWTGWGEEAILAGKQIDAACRPRGELAGVGCAQIGIWSIYNARWFPLRAGGVHQSGGSFVMGDGWPAGADTYYVINRQLIAGGLLQTFPGIAPDFVVSYRGFAMAWVFRGDRLKHSGYRFVWPQ